jgi:hypothetical protein
VRRIIAFDAAVDGSFGLGGAITELSAEPGAPIAQAAFTSL